MAAIPGRFDRLLTCAQLSHTRSTRGSSATTIQWAPNHRFGVISTSNFELTSGRTRRCVASHGGFGGHPRAVRPSPDMCSTIPYPQYARIIRHDDPMGPKPPFRCDFAFEFEFASGRTRRCVASHGGFGGHPRAVRPSPAM